MFQIETVQSFWFCSRKCLTFLWRQYESPPPPPAWPSIEWSNKTIKSWITTTGATLATTDHQRDERDGGAFPVPVSDNDIRQPAVCNEWNIFTPGRWRNIQYRAILQFWIEIFANFPIIIVVRTAARWEVREKTLIVLCWMFTTNTYHILDLIRLLTTSVWSLPLLSGPGQLQSQ